MTSRFTSSVWEWMTRGENSELEHTNGSYDCLTFQLYHEPPRTGVIQFLIPLLDPSETSEENLSYNELMVVAWLRDYDAYLRFM